MKYCQGPKCHEYKTKDRIRGHKGDKHYETRRRSSFYYGNGNFCDQRCMYNWIELHGQQAVDHFGRIHEPKRTDASGAWYKQGSYNYNSNNQHYFVNDLLGERRPITEQQYQDDNYTSPN